MLVLLSFELEKLLKRFENRGSVSFFPVYKRFSKICEQFYKTFKCFLRVAAGKDLQPSLTFAGETKSLPLDGSTEVCSNAV